MSIALATWGIELEAGKTVDFLPPNDIKITNVALGDLADEKGRTIVKITIPVVSVDNEDSESEEDHEGKSQSFTVCSLTAGKTEHAKVDIILSEMEPYKFEVVGKNNVSLLGYYVDQGANQPPGEDSDLDSDEDEHDLRFVSSDVEVSLEDLEDMDSDASRFEEVDEEAEKSLKRPRDSLTVNDASKPLSKAEKKKNKKQKLQDGTAAPSGEEAEKPAKGETKDGEKADEKKGKDKKDKKTPVAVKELPSGLKLKDTTVGTGPMAKKGQTISMRYIGKLTNGKIFDSNTKGKPFTFRLGAGEVIRGWDEGIVGMQVGGERVLTVPPLLGYGKKGSPPQIPGNATLIFEVKCISIK
ncbi:hypothetical protein BDP27DRAFT_1449876 [Rhodocollybia butyracea]|uniref:peptidylprolyl isomerase n=1 Tax=Rhodocollybia butyracea TaxID=206335 RepID=A0A9P5PN36_9AGAR|nr:hypothetical protein BDP27DRAFT_1449876 [Rhodocollybia butyracea]